MAEWFVRSRTQAVPLMGLSEAPRSLLVGPGTIANPAALISSSGRSMMTDATDETAGPENAAKLQAVKTEAERIGDDVTSLGISLKELLEAHAREKPLQTVAIALGIGWVLGKRL